MSAEERVTIRKLATGVPGLDEILGGGLPEYSFNIIAGAPGCGKTTLAHQVVFANATAERPALYFTVLGGMRVNELCATRRRESDDGAGEDECSDFRHGTSRRRARKDSSPELHLARS